MNHHMSVSINHTLIVLVSYLLPTLVSPYTQLITYSCSTCCCYHTQSYKCLYRNRRIQDNHYLPLSAITCHQIVLLFILALDYTNEIVLFGLLITFDLLLSKFLIRFSTNCLLRSPIEPFKR